MIAILAVALVALVVNLAIVWTFARALEAARREATGERERFAAERTMLHADHRAEIRELLNRYQFPTIMPTTRHAPPVAPAPADSVRDKQRRAWLGVGRVEPPLTAVPDVNGADDELGDEVP